MASPAEDDSNERILKSIAEEYGVDPRPTVEVVKVATPRDREALIATCMDEQGFAQGIEGEYAFTDEQRQAFGIAMYICEARYPLDPKYWPRPPTHEQRLKMYHYWVDTQVPCLEALGYTIPAPPTLQAWLGGEDWAPYFFVVPASHVEEQELERNCPTTPPDYYD